MKKLKLIYNPFSGDRTFKNAIDDIVFVFQNAGYETHLFRSIEKGDIENHIAGMKKNYYDAVVVAGGDGTVNIVLNALMNFDHSIPLGIIPAGTANDFASFLKLPRDPAEAAEVIAGGNITDMDIGTANDKYFINVCSAGLLTNISQQVDEGVKNSIGKLAYYLKGIEQIPNFVPISVRITNSSEVFEEDIYLFLTLNSSGAGGFDKLSATASVSDGKFDFIAFKACPIAQLAVLFVKVLAGDCTSDSNILHFQDDYIKIEMLSDNSEFAQTDVDGEKGPVLPIEIRNIHKAVKIFTCSEST